MCQKSVIIPAAAPQPDPVAAGGQAGDKGQRRGVSRRVGGWQVGGRLLNAERPAPVSLRHVFGHMVPDLVLGALAQALPGQILAEGAGALFAALGVEVSEPLGWLAARYGLEATLARCDVVVTGVESLDFHAVGGPVVRFVVEAAGKAMRPAVVVAGRNWVSSRELRLIGVEDAYATLAGPGDEPCTPDELRRVAAGVARTWRW